MATRRNYREVDENSSQKVFELRKSGQLVDAYDLAIKLYKQDPTDEWTQKAYAWVLIDIIKNEIKKNSGKANNFFKQLLSINISDDEIIIKQINFLKPKLDSNYKEVQQAETQSKNGNHTLAIDLFRKLKNQSQLPPPHHESFGWAIYRYVNFSKDILPTDEVKKLLFEYLQLNTPRPGLLHSVILKFAISYASSHSQLDLYKFFQIWNPKYLRHEDKEEESDSGKIYPSLLKRLLRVFVEKQYQIDVPYLRKVIGSGELVIDSIRETYFWILFNLHKENKHKELWKVFDFYVSNYSNYGASHWHSEILKIAVRFMVDADAWRFFDFFRQWNAENFQYGDWHEEIHDEFKVKPLVINALKKLFQLAKLPTNKDKEFRWVLPAYKEALRVFDDDIWILREYATLLGKSGKTQEAIKIYKNIILDLNDQAYIWHEFAEVMAEVDSETAISMLCRAISIQNNEDFLGDVHLLLSKLLVSANKLQEAKNELDTYKVHRIEKGWKLTEEYKLLENQLQEISTVCDNSEFYKSNNKLAEEYILSNIPWGDFLLYDKWETEKQKEMAAFSNLGEIEFAVNSTKFEVLTDSSVNDIFQIKSHYDKSKKKYIALKMRRSSCDHEDFIDNNASTAIAIVDHINEDKKLFHYVVNANLDGIILFSETQLRPVVGDFIKIRYFTTLNHKQNKKMLRMLSIETTVEQNPSLMKTISGELNLKYKNDGRTLDYQNIVDGDKIDIDTTKPDFAFIDDYYVPKYVLRKYNITTDCEVTVKVLFNAEKWSVFDLVQ